MRSVFALLTLATAAACIAAGPDRAPDRAASATRLYTTDAQRAIVYGAAFRLIRLADGSDLLLLDKRSPNEARSVDGFLASVHGPTHDRPLRTSILLPRGVVAEGTSGHIYSASMSDDHQHLALVVGWLGASDNRGHNGVVVLKKTDRGGIYFWERTSWFDVKGMTIGEIAFGPGDQLIVTSRDEKEPAAAVTLFSRDGTKLATFAGESAPATRSWSPHYMRLARISAESYGLYDPESSVVRILGIGSDASIREQGRVDVPFAARGNLVDFQSDGGDGFIFVRMPAEAGTGMLVSHVDARGSRERRSTRSWQIGYVEKRAVHGVLRPGTEGVAVETVPVPNW